MVKTINPYAVPILKYSAGIVNWSLNELDDIDCKRRKLMTIHKGLHPKSDVHHLYLPRKSGGRGLLNIKQIVNVEKQALSHYISSYCD